MTHSHTEDEPALNEAQTKVIRSIRTSRIVLPIAIGIGAVLFLLYRRFDPQEFAQIEWTGHTFFWIGLCLLLLTIRHLSYATRIYILTKGFFSFKKCIELIFIWEFSSAVSPTSIGGSAVALVVLSQERLSAARTAAIVIYTIVLDTTFFVVSIPLLYTVFGNVMIAPNVTSLFALQGWGLLFVVMYLVMFAYGALFAYGLFLNPAGVKRFLVWSCRLPFLRRFSQKAAETGDELMVASKEILAQRLPYHLGAFVATAVAWSFRFLLLVCLIIAFEVVDGNFMTNFLIFSRLESMFIIMLFSPTPGGAGFAEFLFGNFLSDFVTPTRALTIAFIWRIFNYYFFLLAGAIIVPNWLRTVLNRRRKAAKGG